MTHGTTFCVTHVSIEVPSTSMHSVSRSRGNTLGATMIESRIFPSLTALARSSPVWRGCSNPTGEPGTPAKAMMTG